MVNMLLEKEYLGSMLERISTCRDCASCSCDGCRDCALPSSPEKNYLGKSSFNRGVANKPDLERNYLESMMPYTRQYSKDSHNCVTGCKDCVPCGGND